LPVTFRAKRFDYALVCRYEDVAIYRQSQNGVCVGYEVIFVSRQDATTMEMGGNKIQLEAKEVYPPLSAWGRLAYTTRTERHAFDIFHSMLVVGSVVVGEESTHRRKKYIEVTPRVAKAIWAFSEVPLFTATDGRVFRSVDSEHLLKECDVFLAPVKELEQENFKILNEIPSSCFPSQK